VANDDYRDVPSTVSLITTCSRVAIWDLMAENSGAEPGGRGPGRPFPKGVSGNPGGRSKRAEGLETALRQAHDPPKVLAVVDKLRELALAGDVQAARVYLDRVAGPVRVNDEERVEIRALELVRRMQAEVRARCDEQESAQPATSGGSTAIV
jgi:hypothetical protein